MSTRGSLLMTADVCPLLSSLKLLIILNKRLFAGFSLPSLLGKLLTRGLGKEEQEEREEEEDEEWVEL